MTQRVSAIARHLTQYSALSTQHLFFLIAALALVSCTTATIPTPTRIALLAPFEGRYREVGYNALYAARLALADANQPLVELLPIDDGGTASSAADRARALATDPQVQIVLTMGFAVTTPETLAAFGDLPVLVIGDWGAQPVEHRVFVLSNADLDDLLTIPARTSVTDAAHTDTPASLVGGEVLALDQFGLLRSSLAGIRVVSSAALPDSDFAARYASSDQFAPEPGLLASLAYDATRMAIDAMGAATSRASVSQVLSGIVYSGLNGDIAFENGYWRDAPVHLYAYDENGALLPVDRVIE